MSTAEKGPGNTWGDTMKPKLLTTTPEEAHKLERRRQRFLDRKARQQAEKHELSDATVKQLGPLARFLSGRQGKP
jgi:hypothetical protein